MTHHAPPPDGVLQVNGRIDGDRVTVRARLDQAVAAQKSLQAQIVLRDTQVQSIPSSALVPGDIMRIEATTRPRPTCG